MVWYGIGGRGGNRLEPIWGLYLENSTPALLLLDPHAYMRALMGLRKYDLLVTHMAVATEVQQDPMCGLTCLRLIQSVIGLSCGLLSNSVLTETYAMLQEDSKGADVQSEVKIQFMSRCSRFKSGYL